jgi:hypothetical protein
MFLSGFCAGVGLCLAVIGIAEAFMSDEETATKQRVRSAAKVVVGGCFLLASIFVFPTI